MTPLQRYQQDITAGHITADEQQAMAMQHLQDVYDAVLNSAKSPLISRLTNHLKRKQEPVRGIYLWGGVGIGKTYMMDIFYESLPLQEKRRMHFHHFMRMVHQQLQQLEGHPDPLKLIAKRLSQQVRVLCFDEFFVKDIGDAMLLAGLLEALFQRGVTLVATSNVEPDDLYHNGLQRGNFLPAIELIKKYTLVWHVDSNQDYRLRHLSQFGGYICPLDDNANIQLKNLYHHLAHGAVDEPGVITINQREVPYRAMHADAIWFEFDIICNVPRSQMDYMEIANQFNSVIVSNVPIIGQDQLNAATYLINLVDVFYDSRVKLVLSAAATLDEIYPANGGMAFEFERTKSRLQEMQSEDYWHQAK
jgi:cell division protein ZapE